MFVGPALIQADLDYQKADLDKKVQQHVMASQGHSVKLDRAFIMAIEMVCLFLCLFKPYEALISNFRCDKCVCIWVIAFETGTLTHNTVIFKLVPV